MLTLWLAFQKGVANCSYQFCDRKLVSGTSRQSFLSFPEIENKVKLRAQQDTPRVTMMFGNSAKRCSSSYPEKVVASMSAYLLYARSQVIKHLKQVS